MLNKTHPAVVFGMSETALGVVRSLGENGIKVFGINHCNQSGFYSKYVSKKILADPISNENLFVEQLKEFLSHFDKKAVLFITSDEYLKFYVKNHTLIDELFLHNLSSPEFISSIQDKYTQYEIVKKTSIDVPKTFFCNNIIDVKKYITSIRFPIFVKGRDVDTWRRAFGGFVKGFYIEDKYQLLKILIKVHKKTVPVIIQEVVQSDDRGNYKVCVYVDKNGEVAISFTMQKIHQYPINFGVASTAISIKNEELMQLGIRLFQQIGYRGVGSAEFKYDNRDSKYKLIEINTRYWQQNTLADYCELNIPLLDYKEATSQKFHKLEKFKEGLKWSNLTLSFSSFLQYRKSVNMSFITWYKDVTGNTRFSFFSRNDMAPFIFHIIRYFKKNTVKLIQGKRLA